MSVPDPRPSRGIDLRSMFRALRHRNYRLFFFGQGISLVGTWMQQVAVGWLVYRMTSSPIWLGVVGFVGQIPTFLISPVAGVLADRHERRSLLIVTQVAALLQASLLAFLVLSQRIQVWHVVALSAFLGIINSFDIPVRQSFTIEMVEEREDLGNAIALNSSMINAARLIGPSAAGLLIAWAGEGVCFFLNAVSYIPVVLSLCAMKVVARRLFIPEQRIWHELREGLAYGFRSVPIRWILFILSVVSLMGVAYPVLMPVFAKDVFRGGPHTLGFLMAMSGAGALAGALFLAARRSVVGLGKVLARMAGLFGISMIALSLSRSFSLSLLISWFSGFGMIVHTASCNTILQTIVEEDKRGRVMSLYTMSFMGMAPFGSLLAGGLAGRIGAPLTIFFSGACCVAGAVVFLRKLPLVKAKIRPIYAQKGIIPEVVTGP